MNKISSVVLPGNLEVDILFKNGKLGYTFLHEGKNYGNAVKLPSKSVTDIASVCLVLFTNAVETKEALK
jgi:hypothetical protein